MSFNVHKMLIKLSIKTLQRIFSIVTLLKILQTWQPHHNQTQSTTNPCHHPMEDRQELIFLILESLRKEKPTSCIPEGLQMNGGMR